jgi:hypothetical protein
MDPHQTDQPHPTKQKIIVKACEMPTIQLITNDPIRPRAPSCCEKRGMPMQRQKNPLKIVPERKEKICNVNEISIKLASENEKVVLSHKR